MIKAEDKNQIENKTTQPESLQIRNSEDNRNNNARLY